MKTITRAFKWLALLQLLFLTASRGLAQDVKTGLLPEPMTNAHINDADELVVTPSATSSSHDFDFLAGDWNMHNKRLKGRLNNNTEWVEYESTSHNFGTILSGIGNMDIYKTTYNTNGSNTPYEGLTVRTFDPKTRLWRLYWVASDIGIMDPPVVGSFQGNVGWFYCRDTFRGKPILMRFMWDKTDPNNPVWNQSFSPDNGKTWEMNMANVCHRMK